eukprot:gene3892-7105_t
MTKSEANMLYRLNKIQIYSVGKLTEEEEETLKNFKLKIQKNLKMFNGKGFVKLSSRSLKDSGFISQKYSNLVEEMKKEWIEKYNLKIDSKNEIQKSIQNSIEQICCVKCLEIESPEDAVELLINSQRTLIDLMIALEKNDSNFLDLELIIKKFYNFEISYEMRGFVRNKKLLFLNISQKNIFLGFQSKIADLLYMKDYTIDFVLYDDEISIIELNSFGEIAGAALFSWIDDEEILYNGPFQFRNVGNLTNHTCPMPYKDKHVIIVSETTKQLFIGDLSFIVMGFFFIIVFNINPTPIEIYTSTFGNVMSKSVYPDNLYSYSLVYFHQKTKRPTIGTTKYKESKNYEICQNVTCFYDSITAPGDVVAVSFIGLFLICVSGSICHFLHHFNNNSIFNTINSIKSAINIQNPMDFEELS